ncbi:mitochondrial fission regulator 2 [Syngnathus typhle]|uniref:mitochondrial fission regulator 2 n=1 Tax=Syngnathus typhle TaxID=161592 RepID=UPI002A6AD08E|nr:mitochondrial fission regulator 2 [Syngnathus typhle]XP_061126420.1 mitochondrial fission regulator 2 [Syngnathus typhle]
MSLLEDALEVLRMVLDYFGVPPEMLVPVWDSRLCGQYRSMVRMIGSNLPLNPAPRVYFQIPLTTYADLPTEAPAIPSFADLLWVLEDEEDGFAKSRHHLPAKTPVRQRPRPARQMQPEALQKISALESELLKLRAQIATLVTATSGLSESHKAAGTPLMSPIPAAALTSTPRCAPPPPPPPPPPCPAASSVTELIRRRKCGGKDADKKRIQAVPSRPSLLDVLKDLNQVKLRSVERSPGGTPVPRRRSRGGRATPPKDPASLIAEALKRKFAQHRHNLSDKENSLESSPFGSPDTPKMVHHPRRSQTFLHL